MRAALLFVVACKFAPQATPAGGADAPLAEADGGGDGAPADWWDPAFHYRAKITIVAGPATDGGYSIVVSADTGALVGAGKATASGDDWRIVRRTASGWIELDRWVDDAAGSGWNGNDTRTWFALPEVLADAATDDATYAYYGDPSAGAPPADLNRVFLFGDDFETDSAQWPANNLGETVSLDAVNHRGGAASLKLVTNGTAGGGVHHDISLPQRPVMFSHWVRQAQTGKSFGYARGFDCTFANRNPPTFIDGHLRLATELDSGDKLQIWTQALDNWSPSVPANEWHQVDTVFDPTLNQVTARYDGGAWHPPKPNDPYRYLQGTPILSVDMDGEGNQPGTFWVDNYILRLAVDPEPAATLGPEEILPSD